MDWKVTDEEGEEMTAEEEEAAKKVQEEWRRWLLEEHLLCKCALIFLSKSIGAITQCHDLPSPDEYDEVFSSACVLSLLWLQEQNK